MGPASVANEIDTVSVLILTMNEVNNIASIVLSIPAEYEVILRDLSTDGTAEAAKRVRPDVRIVRRGPRELGKGAAIRLGFRDARGPVVVMMDGDGSNRPSEIVKLISALKAENGSFATLFPISGATIGH